MLFVTVQIVFEIVKYLSERINCALLDEDEDEDTMFTVLSGFRINWDDHSAPNSRLSANENDLNGIKFSPPPFEQRYATVRAIIDPENKVNVHFRKVVEFGCADVKMVQLLKYVENLEELIFVDKDREILEQCKWRIEPDEDDSFYYRRNPLHAKIYEGCSTKYDEVLKDADVVFCIELIQTLSPDELEGTIKNIFENIQPEMVIFTTPNKEFNPLLDLTSNLTRHKTHKFEWTRNELRTWGRNLGRRYPNYVPFFYACGVLDKKYLQKLGPLTQICALRRIYKEPRQIEKKESGYEFVAEAEYLYLSDEQLLEQATKLIKQVKPDDWSKWEYTECREYEIPLCEVFSELYYRTGFERFLNVIHADGWEIDEMRNVIISSPHHNFSKSSQGE